MERKIEVNRTSKVIPASGMASEHLYFVTRDMMFQKLPTGSMMLAQIKDYKLQLTTSLTII
jgi:hypothetical protein